MTQQRRHLEGGVLASRAGLARWRAGTNPSAGGSADGSAAAAAVGTAAPLAAAAPPSGQQPSGCPASPDYLWVGQTRTLIPALAPGERMDVPLQVNYVCPCSMHARA
jgi:hypothetical protein